MIRGVVRVRAGLSYLTFSIKFHFVFHKSVFICWPEAFCLQVSLKELSAYAVCSSYNLDMEERKEGVNWSDHKTLSLGETGTLCVTGPNQVRAIPFFSSFLVLETIRRGYFLCLHHLSQVYKVHALIILILLRNFQVIMVKE